MDSAAPPDASSGGAEPTETPAQAVATTSSVPAKSRWAPEIKVYSRKYQRKNPEPPPDPSPNYSPVAESLASIRGPEAGDAASRADSAAPASPSPAPAAPPPHEEPTADTDDSSSRPASRADPAAPTSPSPAPPTAASHDEEPTADSEDFSSGPASRADPAATASPSPAPPAAPPQGEPTAASDDFSPGPASRADPAARTSPSPAPPAEAPHGEPSAASDDFSPGPASRADPAAPTSPSPAPSAAAPHGEPTAATEDFSPGLARDGASVPNGHIDIRAAADEKARKRRARSELRRQLASELDHVRVLSSRLRTAAEALPAEAEPLPVPVVQPPPQLAAGYAQSQFPVAGPVTPAPAQVTDAAAPVHSLLQRRPLTVSVVHTESLEKEKRTPKANQLYQNSEFLLAKYRIPPTDSHGRKKSKHHKKKHRSSAAHGVGYDADQRLYSHAFKKSSSLLSRLMKHKFGWVFNKPVDPVALGLHDYFVIIKHPMDLGTIKGKLTRGQYSNPKEFADDVRLTFRNAMTYNPRGQDVHFMAEQLLGIFEAQWPEIEAEVEYLASCPPLPTKFPPPPIDLRLLDRQDSAKHHMALDSKSRPISHTPTYSVRTPSLKKPKARDLHKRDMTIDEKRKLSNNLQNLPPEKLDVVVQIIRNKNLSVRQHDDEIEVEIDSMDAETLWELDRFVANYKKNLSKQKRKAEREMLARQDVELRALHGGQQTNQDPNIGERSPKQSKIDLMVSEQLPTSVPDQSENNVPNASRSSSSSSSSSGSESSSSDSDSDSSSTDGSPAAKSS